MEIRDRIRSNLDLVNRLDEEGKPCRGGHIESTSDNLKLNEPVLIPICHLMEKNELKPPALDRIIQQIGAFYTLAKLWGGYESYYHQAWAVRRLLGKLKTYTYRDLPPEDRP